MLCTFVSSARRICCLAYFRVPLLDVCALCRVVLCIVFCKNLCCVVSPLSQVEASRSCQEWEGERLEGLHDCKQPCESLCWWKRCLSFLIRARLETKRSRSFEGGRGGWGRYPCPICTALLMIQIVTMAKINKHIFVGQWAWACPVKIGTVCSLLLQYGDFHFDAKGHCTK